jgi:plasmid stabilization system protein ParE
MAKPLRFHPRIASDLRGAIQWYDDISGELAARFRAAAHSCFDQISDQPGRFPLAFEEVRFARLERFPYLVLFRDRLSSVELIGVFHAASDPEKWRRRASAS